MFFATLSSCLGVLIIAFQNFSISSMIFHGFIVQALLFIAFVVQILVFSNPFLLS